jgi:hypothetical protein
MIFIVRGLDAEGRMTFYCEVEASCRDRAAEIALSRLPTAALVETWRLVVTTAEPPATVLPDLLDCWGVVPRAP